MNLKPSHKPSRDNPQPLGWAIALSILLHLGILFGIKITNATQVKKTLSVSLVSLPPQKKEAAQIVSPSEAPELPPQLATKRLSDTNQRADKERIRRGEESSKPSLERKQVAELPQKKQLEEPTQSPKIQLKSKALTEVLASSGPSKLTLTPQPNRNSEISQILNNPNLVRATPFSRASRTAPFQSRLGVSDYLPSVEDGDITLLNAKAHKHATFVRRVAKQVFGALKRRSWATLPSGEIRGLQGFSTIEAVLNKSGELIKINVKEESGSQSFDQVVSGAVRDGAWDKNPPRGVALADGNIHFVFRARTWTRTIGERSRETRWVLLGTGLL